MSDSVQKIAANGTRRRTDPGWRHEHRPRGLPDQGAEAATRRRTAGRHAHRTVPQCPHQTGPRRGRLRGRGVLRGDTMIVETTTGRVRGADGTFRGIPYATAERFEAP